MPDRLPSRLPAGQHAVHLRLAPGVARTPRPVRWAEAPLVLRRASGAHEVIGVTGDLARLARYVLSLGAHAEVLAPPVLRARVAAEARAVARLYTRPPPADAPRA
jgi:proteasome accessory factor B